MKRFRTASFIFSVTSAFYLTTVTLHAGVISSEEKEIWCLQSAISDANSANYSLEMSITPLDYSPKSAANASVHGGDIPNINNLPSAPTPLPEDSVVLPTQYPRFRWTYYDFDGDPQGEYLIQISTASDFSMLFSQSGWRISENQEAVYNSSVPQGKYYWCVAVRDKWWGESSLFSSGNFIAVSTSTVNAAVVQEKVLGTNRVKVVFEGSSNILDEVYVKNLQADKYLAGSGALSASPVAKTVTAWGQDCWHTPAIANSVNEYEVVAVSQYDQKERKVKTLYSAEFNVEIATHATLMAARKAVPIVITNGSPAALTAQINAKNLEGAAFPFAVYEDVNGNGVLEDAERIEKLSYEFTSYGIKRLFLEVRPIGNDNLTGSIEVGVASSSGYEFVNKTVSVAQKNVDTGIPRDPANILIEINEEVTMSWAGVSMNTDGTPCDDIAHYELYGAADEGFVFQYLGKSTSTWISGYFNSSFYKVLAVDNAGNKSPGHSIASVDGSVITVSSDGLLYTIQSEGGIRITRISGAGTGMLAQYKIESDAPLTAPVDVYMNVGSASLNPSAARAISAAENNSFCLGVFYYNGVEWIRINTPKSASSGVYRFRVSRTGLYGVADVEPMRSARVTKVAPKKFTPNGDSINDAAIIYYANPRSVPISGKIFSVHGALMAEHLKDDGTSLSWGGKDSYGYPCEEGVYIFQIDIGGEISNGTIILAK